MLFQQYKGSFSLVAWTEGKFPPFSKFPSRQQQSKELLFNILLLLSMRFVDKRSAADARADLPSALPMQQQDQSRAVLSLLSQSAAARGAERRPALPPDCRASRHPAAAEEALFPPSSRCHCSRTSTEGRSFFVHLQRRSIGTTARRTSLLSSQCH